jgi:epoxyqueuosine reductase
LNGAREIPSGVDDLLARIRAIAATEGALVRVTSAEADARARDRMRASFARGDLETWRYGEAYARVASDPATLLAGARSVVCVAVPYATRPPADLARAPLRGRVSNYAWSPDYHVPMRALLERIACELRAFAGEGSARFACDTAPIAERAFAERSGLAWIGKHTCAIVPGIGSYVFLGDVATTIAFAPDAPLRKQCGSCTRCIRACPTGALRGDSTIDARRCISDLTQRVDGIPYDLRPFVGEWVWGCDLCQEACPPTRNAGVAASASARFAAVDGDAAHPDLLGLLELKSSVFRKRYRHLGLGWRGAAILRRNAAVALGNRLDRAAAEPLARALSRDPHPIVRGHAAWALGRLANDAALLSLRTAREHERDSSVLAEIALALAVARFELGESVPALKKL